MWPCAILSTVMVNSGSTGGSTLEAGTAMTSATATRPIDSETVQPGQRAPSRATPRVDASPESFGCPVARTAQIMGNKWTPLIVRDLAAGQRRFSELERSLHGISPKTLSERLKRLEE